jgi:hypothetical protein
MMHLRPVGRFAALAVVVALSVATAAAQRGFFGGGGPRGPFRIYPNIPYDGRFTFVRVNYQTAPGGFWYGGWPAWGHGYPLAEQNLMRIMNEVSFLSPHMDEINNLSFEDPELFKYPVAYVIEVGWWAMTDREGQALREYIAKGGFVIVDDFKTRGYRGDGGWDVFAASMRRAMPEARFFDMDASHPIYHTFFEINDLDVVPQAYIAGRPIFRGLFEDNDPTRRLQIMVNFNTDISQFWEWSGTGLRPIADTNESYKLGVNYIIYGMTH